MGEENGGGGGGPKRTNHHSARRVVAHRENVIKVLTLFACGVLRAGRAIGTCINRIGSLVRTSHCWCTR